MTAIPLAMVLMAAAAPSVQRAALLNMRGESAAARAEIAAVLADHPQAPSALFTAACIAIEAGALQQARAYTGTLRVTIPAPPHADVLEGLIDRRERDPSEPIDKALVEAWTKAGRPDLSTRPLLPKVEEWGALLPELSRETLEAMTAAQRFLFAKDAQATADETLKLALEAARTPDVNALAVNVEVLGLIGHHDAIPPALKAAVDAAVSKLGPRVVAADAGNGYLEVASWLATGRPDQAISESEVALLERAVARPRFAVPRAAMFKELRQMARESTRNSAPYGRTPQRWEPRSRSLAFPAARRPPPSRCCEGVLGAC